MLLVSRYTNIANKKANNVSLNFAQIKKKIIYSLSVVL